MNKMLMPNEIVLEIIQWIDDNPTISKLMQTCSTINDLLTYLISHQSSFKNLKSFRIVHSIKNLPKFILKTKPRSRCQTGFLNLWVYLVEDDQALYLSFGPWKTSLEFYEICFLDSSYHYLSNCHYLQNDDKIVVHLSRETEIILNLWPDFYISSQKTQYYNNHTSPFCKRCEQLYLENIMSLPISSSYQILLKSDTDVMFCDCFVSCLNRQNVRIFTYMKKFRKYVWVDDQLIRVMKLYNDLLIVGYWIRSTKRQYRVYHLIDFEHIMEYQLISKRRGKTFGVFRKVVSLDMNRKEMTFASKKTKFEAILCLVDVHQFK
jgi:hypothetical protein